MPYLFLLLLILVSSFSYADETKTTDEKVALADPAKTDLASSVQSGLFLKYGFTIGAALTVHIPLHIQDNQLKVLAITNSAYVGIFPWYFFVGPNSNSALICSGLNSSAPSTKEIQQDQVKSADKMKALIYGTSEEFGTLYVDAYNHPLYPTVVAKYNSVKPNCALSTIGLFVGIPANFSANTIINNVEASRTIKPLLSFGLIFQPSPIVSILLGMTYSNINGDSTTTSSLVSDVQIFSGLIAIGGNLDLVSLLLKQ